MSSRQPCSAIGPRHAVSLGSIETNALQLSKPFVSGAREQQAELAAFKRTPLADRERLECGPVRTIAGLSAKIGTP